MTTSSNDRIIQILEAFDRLMEEHKQADRAYREKLEKARREGRGKEFLETIKEYRINYNERVRQLVRLEEQLAE